MTKRASPENSFQTSSLLNTISNKLHFSPITEGKFCANPSRKSWFMKITPSSESLEFFQFKIEFFLKIFKEITRLKYGLILFQSIDTKQVVERIYYIIQFILEYDDVCIS